MSAGNLLVRTVIRDRSLFMPPVGAEEKRLFGQFSLLPNLVHYKIIATQPI